MLEVLFIISLCYISMWAGHKYGGPKQVYEKMKAWVVSSWE